MLSARTLSSPAFKDIEAGSLTSRPRTNRIKPKKALPLKTANNNIFITQNEPKKDLTDDITATNSTEYPKLIKSPSYKTIADNRVKGILLRLSSTMDRLQQASDSCEKTLTRNMSNLYKDNAEILGTTLHRHSKSSTTFPLTQQISELSMLNPSTTKSSMANNFLSMSEMEFLNPQTARTMYRNTQSIDLNPYATPVSSRMWGHINEGMTYSNELRYEIANKAKLLEQLKDKLAYYDRLIESASKEKEIEKLKNSIEKVEYKIETEEFNQEKYDYMIHVKQKDLVLGWQRFKLISRPFQKVNRELEKNIDDILELNKFLQKQTDDFKAIQKLSDKQKKEINQINHRRADELAKMDNLEKNLEIEDAFAQKRKQLIRETKKDIEEEKIRKLENKRRLNRRRQTILNQLITSFEKDFEQLSSVSKHFPDKMEYVHYYDELDLLNREVNRGLEERIKKLLEEINRQKKDELPALKDELQRLKETKKKEKVLFEARDLANMLHDKSKRNQDCEERITHQQELLTNATRGVMTIFFQLLKHKKELGLEKLDEVNIKFKSLGDILLLSGEILDSIRSIHNEPSEIKSHNLSASGFSSEDMI